MRKGGEERKNEAVGKRAQEEERGWTRRKE